MDPVIVQGQGDNHNSKSVLSLRTLIPSSFYLSWEKNTTYQLQGTLQDDESTGYDLLSVESSLWYQGQEFIVKQVTHDYVSGYATKAFTATHVYSECQWFRKREIRTGVLTYRPADVMHYVFDGNPLGFSFEIIGDFPSAQIENLGDMSGQDALSKIVEVWPDAIIYPDNRHIKVYQHDRFAINRGHRFGYLYNTSEQKFTPDSTTIQNKVWCIGKEKDKPEGAPDDSPTEYFFEPFEVVDQASIDRWGPHEMPTISDDRFTDPESMRRYALSQMTDPALTVEITTTVTDQPIPGDVMHTEVREDDISTDVEIVGYQWYPYDNSQFTQVTLNDTAKTILDYQSNLRSRFLSDFQRRNSVVNSNINSMNDQITELQNKIKEMNGKFYGKRMIALGDSITQGWSPDESTEPWPGKVKTLLGLEDVFNAGQGGGATYRESDVDNPRDLKYNVVQRSFQGYDICTIAYGMNDFYMFSRGDLQISMAKDMVTEIRNRNPSIKIFALLPTPVGPPFVPRSGPFTWDNECDTLKNAYQSVGVPVLDFRDNPPIFADGGLSSDGEHPNSTGYKKMATRISQFLENNY